MVTIQNYVRASSLEEAYELNQKKQNRIIGGMLWLRLGNGSFNTAIDLCDLGLNKIEETEETISIGAYVTLRDIEKHEGLNAYSMNTVRAAVENIVGVQFRNMATVGGSIFGRFGFSDVLTVFLAMDSYAELYKGGIVPLKDFAAMKADNDILLRLIVKKTPGRFVYRAFRNQATDFPVLTCAAFTGENGTGISVGARPGRAVLFTDENGIFKNGITKEGVEEFVSLAAENIPVSGNSRGSSEYRAHLLKVLAQRNFEELGGLQ